MKLQFTIEKPSQKDTSKMLTTVFIDYESLYWSFIKQFKEKPDLQPIITDIKTLGRIHKIKVFGDFTKSEIDQERRRIRTITSDIIDCGNESTEKKDFVDFIMLDHIYQEVIQNPTVEQFILLTGDGHFSSVATFLKTFMDKTVGVYGIPETLSNQLRSCSTWTKIISVIDDDDEVYISRLFKNMKTAQDKGLILTFGKTTELTSEFYGGSLIKYRQILNHLINDGFVKQELCNAFSDKEFTMIVPQWDKINSDSFKPTR